MNGDSEELEDRCGNKPCYRHRIRHRDLEGYKKTQNKPEYKEETEYYEVSPKPVSQELQNFKETEYSKC
jgi:hypothetical protein